MERYFYTTIHFSPSYEESSLLEAANGLFRDRIDGNLYRKRLLYDCGWGQEEGFERLPPLTFSELIKLVETPFAQCDGKRFCRTSTEDNNEYQIWMSNLLGAISVIMSDHTEELIEFLSAHANPNHFSDSRIRQNYKRFSFDPQKDEEEGRIPGGIGTRSYREVLDENPAWRQIAGRVVDLIYSKDSSCNGTGDGSPSHPSRARKRSF